MQKLNQCTKLLFELGAIITGFALAPVVCTLAPVTYLTIKLADLSPYINKAVVADRLVASFVLPAVALGGLVIIAVKTAGVAVLSALILPVSPIYGAYIGKKYANRQEKRKRISLLSPFTTRHHRRNFENGYEFAEDFSIYQIDECDCER